MNIEVVELIAKANKIMSVTGKGAGTKYPKSLKKIVVALRVDHGISIKELIKHIPVSSYSAREWPRKTFEKQSFNKIIVKEEKPKAIKKKAIKQKRKIEIVISNQRVLIALTCLLIFDSLASHLFY